MGENKQKIVTVLLLINAILITYFGISLTKKINMQNNILANKISNISHSVSYLENSIPNRIQSVLDDRDNLLDTAEYKYENIDTVNKKAVVNLAVNLKAVSPNSKIYLAYSKIDENNVQEIRLEKKAGLSYYANIELDLDKNYQYDVIEKVDGGGEALLNVNKQYIYLYDELYGFRVQTHSSGSSRSNEQMDLDFSFSIDDYGKYELGIEKVLLEIWYEGNTIDQIDITESIVNSDISSIMNHYNVAVASGYIDSGMGIEEFAEHIEYKPEEKYGSRTYYTYNHSIDYDADYPELELDQNKAKAISYKLIITCKDGYQKLLSY